MTASERYVETALSTAARAAAAQAGRIEAAARLAADAVRTGGFVFAFGTGHSHMLAEELFYRAGGLARVCPIFDEDLMLHRAAARSSELERKPGLAAALLDGVDAVRSGGVMFLFSNSGCNTAAVEMAEEAKKRGLATVAVTSLAHGRRMASRHPGGRKLADVCDVVLDNMGVYGDAAVPVGGRPVGPTSTVVGALLVEAVVCRTVELCDEAGAPAEVFASANTAGGDAANEGLVRKYGPLVKPL